jgi:hypothetical protein
MTKNMINGIEINKDIEEIEPFEFIQEQVKNAAVFVMQANYVEATWILGRMYAFCEQKSQFYKKKKEQEDVYLRDMLKATVYTPKDGTRIQD